MITENEIIFSKIQPIDNSWDNVTVIFNLICNNNKIITYDVNVDGFLNLLKEQITSTTSGTISAAKGKYSTACLIKQSPSTSLGIMFIDEQDNNHVVGNITINHLKSGYNLTIGRKIRENFDNFLDTFIQDAILKIKLKLAPPSTPSELISQLDKMQFSESIWDKSGYKKYLNSLKTHWTNHSFIPE
jgi:hypothetical protein